jgi:hypothetical protein
MAEEDPSKLYVTLPAGMQALFDQLVARKIYGEEKAPVARALIMMGLERLVDQRRLIDTPNIASPPLEKTKPRSG